MNRARTLRCWKLLGACWAVAGVLLLARPAFAQRQGAVTVVRGVFHPSVGDVEFPNAGKKPPQGGNPVQAIFHPPKNKCDIHLPGGNKAGAGFLVEPDSSSKGSVPIKQVRPIQPCPGHVRPVRPLPKPWPLVSPITPGHRPIDPNRPRPRPIPRPITPEQRPVDPDRYQGPPQSDAGPPGQDWPSIEDPPLESGHLSDRVPRVDQHTTPTREWPADDQPAEPARSGQLEDTVAAAEPERQWPSVDDARGDRVALPEARLPNPKLDTDQWMTPEKKGRTDDVNSLPEFGSSGMGLPSGQDIEGWGKIPGVEDNDPFAGPIDPFGKGGTGRPGGPDFGPDGNGPDGPDFGGRQGILNLGSFDPHMPKQDGMSGGAKDGFGGPGPINTNKGPAGSGQAGNVCFNNPSNIRFKLGDDGVLYVQQFYRNNPCGTKSIEYPDTKGKWDQKKLENAVFLMDPRVFATSGDGGVIVQPLVKPEHFRAENVGEKAWHFLGFCEGPIDTGGDRPGPTSADDLNKAKAAGVLVKDPAYMQGGVGGSGLDATQHPSQVSNPGYEGGSAGKVDSGIKSNKELVTDPAESSKN